MNDTPWFFPETIPDALKLLAEEKAHIHAGGTSISAVMMKKWPAVVDISRLPLKQFKWNKNGVEIGAGLDINSLVKSISKYSPSHLLVKALSKSSSHPLRNRITVGGSIASFPIWSDLMGPLIALDSQIKLYRDKEEKMPLIDYLKAQRREKTELITAVSFILGKAATYYHRETRVQFDYPVFTISIVPSGSGQRSAIYRIVVTGTRNKFAKIELKRDEIDNIISNNNNSAGLLKQLDLKFNKKALGSGEYIKHLAGIRLKEGLMVILEDRS